MDESCRCKGTNFWGFLKAAEGLYPDIPAEALIAESPLGLRDLVANKTLLADAWYPIHWYNSLHDGLRRETGLPPEECAWNLGYEATRNDFAEGGVYRHAARILSPNTMLLLGQKIFGFYWNPGNLKTQKLGKKKAHGLWTQCEGFNVNTWQDILGSTARVLELAGAHEPTFNILRGGRDDAFMEGEATWL